MAEDSTRQVNLETACRGLRPTTGHYGCLMMMNDNLDKARHASCRRVSTAPRGMQHRPGGTIIRDRGGAMPGHTQHRHDWKVPENRVVKQQHVDPQHCAAICNR